VRPYLYLMLAIKIIFTDTKTISYEV